MNDVAEGESTHIKAYAQLLRPGSEAVVEHLWRQTPLAFEPLEVPIVDIISREAHEREKRLLWDRVWQMACREEHVAEVGDQYIYEICGRSYLIVRSAPDQIQAFYNVCLHRGRLLRDCPGRSSNIRCTYHAFTWNLDGTLRSMPSENEFTTPVGRDWRLPQVQVGVWGGFVFINPDLQAPPLEEYLGELDAHFARWNLADSHVSAHVTKRLRCNWKVGQEGFMEAFHVSTTHPQIALATGGEQSQYDVFGNFSRAITPAFLPDSKIRWKPTGQQVFDAVVGRTEDEPPVVEIPPDASARDVFVALERERLGAIIGSQIDEFEETEIADRFYYSVFPNFHPWGTFNEFVYRFRPDGNDHQACILEVMFLTPFPKGQRPEPAPLVELGFDDSVADAGVLGPLGGVFDQDCFNLVEVQRGLQSAHHKTVIYSAYQEIKIRHFWKLYREWVGSVAADEGDPPLAD